MTRYTPLWEQQGSYAASVDRRLIGAVWPIAASTGCAVTVSSGMTVNVAAGQVSVPTANNTGSVLCASDAVEPVTLAAAPGAGTNRYDLVICQARGNDLDGGANNDFLFTTVTGTAAASPAVPAVPNNAVALAQIYVPGGSASVTAGNIADTRPGRLGQDAFPRGRLASIVTPTPQLVANSNADFGTLSDVPGVPISAGRRTKVSFACQGITSTANGDIFEVRLKENNTTVVALQTVSIVGNNGYTPCSFFVERPNLAAGSYRWQITLSRFSGTGTGGYQAGATSPATLIVEDVGAYP